ncbi:MAG: NADH-quinone oxidoreductase subunit J [Acidobacteriota bacterium]|nr:NADH-quinone oxidoreductase subunit J [Acidobacteriota bacterium]
MEPAFYIAGIIAILSTALTITRLNAVHALLYLIVSLLAVAVVFYAMGAPFVAALEVIVYAGAIMVLFVFVVMMLNLGKRSAIVEGQWMQGRIWVGPVILSAILIAEVVYLILRVRLPESAGGVVDPKQVGLALYGPYLIGVELASMLLLGALVGACHLGRPVHEKAEARYDGNSDGARAHSGGDLIRAGVGRTPDAP